MFDYLSMIIYIIMYMHACIHPWSVSHDVFVTILSQNVYSTVNMKWNIHHLLQLCTAIYVYRLLMHDPASIYACMHVSIQFIYNANENYNNYNVCYNYIVYNYSDTHQPLDQVTCMTLCVCPASHAP